MVERKEFIGIHRGLLACAGPMTIYERDTSIESMPGSDEIVSPERAEQILLGTMHRPDLDIAPRATTESLVAEGDPVTFHTVSPKHVNPLTKAITRMALGTYYQEEVQVLDFAKVLGNKLLNDPDATFSYADVIYSYSQRRRPNTTGATLIIAKGLASEPESESQQREYRAVRQAMSTLSPRLYRVALLGTYDIDLESSDDVRLTDDRQIAV